MDKIF